MAKQDGKGKKGDRDRGARASAKLAPRKPAAIGEASALPGTREELIAHWQEARRRRHEAALGSRAFEEAAEEVARIEVEIARIERAMDPPRV